MVKKSVSYSSIALLVVYAFILLTHFAYYPKWDKQNTEATISWDVSGYYMYLPAFFIYDDLKQCTFQDDILNKYHPSPDFQQAFRHSSGNYVMKYSIGQAIQFSPFFLIAHFWAKESSIYPADGFSFPYQFMISMGSLFLAFLGLFFLRKVLLEYFPDWSVAITLLLLVLGTNYLNYSAIDGAMTHNNLFTIYALLIYATIQFYKKPNWKKALAIGLLVGLAALTRPTEIIALLIPLLWGLNISQKSEWKARLTFFKNHISLMAIAIVSCALVGFIQLAYWKYASGDWIVYSYEDQGFSWLRPHLYDGFLSYKGGWLVYSPIMIFSLIGFYFLYKKHRPIFWPCVSFAGLFIYITFAWDIWWYGGSLGQRAMVQAYPVLAFPFTAFVWQMGHFKKGLKIFIVALMLFFTYFSLWFMHQAHRGGLLHVGQMTKAYFWKTLGTYDFQENNLKLLDTGEEFKGKRAFVKSLYFNDFEKEGIETHCEQNWNYTRGICINKNHQNSEIFEVKLEYPYEWIRIRADIAIKQKEWDVWRMSQFIAKFMDGEKAVKTNLIRIQRLMEDNQQKSIFFDVEVPRENFEKLQVYLWNAEGDKEIHIDNVRIEGFE